MKVYIETYGCRMNICDSEVLMGILTPHGYQYTFQVEKADVVVLNCCSVREIGHTKIYRRIEELEKVLSKDVVLCLAGCMSTQLDCSRSWPLPRVQIIIAPTAYKELPQAICRIKNGEEQHLYIDGKHPEEVYDDILPVRFLEDRITAAVTIMKGCDQYCSYCIEPYTRGQRVNRNYDSIINEVKEIRLKQYKEITLFGHIVDLWEGEKNHVKISFANLLEDLAEKCPHLRIKYISSHPLTYTDEIVRVVKTHQNIMRVVHLPVQSGSDAVLQRMNRRYTIRQFLQRIESILNILPDLQIITDVMVGFPGETENDFLMTIDMLKHFNCADANVFPFSMRQGTFANKHYQDDVPDNVKEERVQVIKEQIAAMRTSQQRKLIGSTLSVIAERHDTDYWYGRDSYHRTVIFPFAGNIREGQCCEILIDSIRNKQLFGTMS